MRGDDAQRLSHIFFNLGQDIPGLLTRFPNSIILRDAHCRNRGRSPARDPIYLSCAEHLIVVSMR
jgi:hypothetical protein